MDNVKTTLLLQQLQQQNRSLLHEISYLKQEVAQLRRLIFGQKRERHIPAGSGQQLDIGLDDALIEQEMQIEQISYQRKKVKPKSAPHGRGALPAHLERHDRIIEPDEDTCNLQKIGEEITEELDYKPGSLFVNRYIRPKYARPDGNGVVIAALPSRPIEKVIPGSGPLAHVAISKFLEHQPLYRQKQRFKRQGVIIFDSTLGDWIKYIYEILIPLYALHKERLLKC